MAHWKRDGRYWVRDDGTRVPYIAGGSEDEPSTADSGGGEDLEKLREALKRANAEAAERRHKLKEYEERLRQFDGIDPDEVRRLKELAQKAEEERLRKEGEFEELLKRRQAEWEKRVEQMQEQAKMWEQRYRQVAVDERLVAAFAKAGAVAPDEAAALTRAMVDLDDDGVYVKGDDGSPLLKDGKRVSIEEFAAQWLEERPHHRKAGPAGAGSVGGRGTPGGKTITRAQFDALSPVERAAVLKEGLRVVDAA